MFNNYEKPIIEINFSIEYTDKYLNNIVIIMESMTILTEYLKDKKDDYVFDPYCRLEFELFNKIDNTVMSER